ncbi:MAG: uracil-DNA glycosylase family protein [Bacteroidales bacterium]|nr:uracil-DNA glycosylase family protein [Bacteroidales bacterium]
MTKAEEKLCVQIARCQQRGVVPCHKFNNPCNQLAEPWNGHLSKAKIMFIGPNPSIDCDEIFPTDKWSDEEIADFFDNRFVNGKKLTSNKRDSVRYWNSLITYTNMINELKGNCYYKGRLAKATKNNGWDYSVLDPYVVSTEIVHCKSKEAYGFEDARCKCSDMWMANILNLFKGKLIVVLGKKAKDAIDKCSKLNAIFVRQNVPIIYLPHPSFPMSDKNRKAAVQNELARVHLP